MGSELVLPVRVGNNFLQVGHYKVQGGLLQSVGYVGVGEDQELHTVGGVDTAAEGELTGRLKLGQLVLVSRTQQLLVGGVGLQVAGVDVLQHDPHSVWVKVLDLHLVVTTLLHVVTEHGLEHRGPAG